jgi:hypothetical protein
MLLAYRLVKLIEKHSDGLAKALQARLDGCERCDAYHKNVPREELTTVVGEIYRHLGEWLLGKSETDIETRYCAIGEKRFKQKVPLSQVLWTIALVKENLWAYIKDNNVMERPAEIFGELEMLSLLDQFIDRAMYYAAVGYERAQNAERQNT